MKKPLSSSGNAWQLYLSKPLIKLLGISKDEYTVLFNLENKVLYIRKIESSEAEKYKNYLSKKLIKRGAGYGLNLPLPILELLEINPELDMVDYEINGKTLIIKKADCYQV